MKRLSLFIMISLLAVAGVQAQRIQQGDKWWDGAVLYTTSVSSSGSAELIGTDNNHNTFRISLIATEKAGLYFVGTRNGALAQRISEMAEVKYIRQEGMNFLAFKNAKGDVAWTMVLTPDNLNNCVAQETWSEMQPVSDLLTGMLLNTTYLARFSKPDLRLMRNEILARKGWRFQSTDLQSYFGRQSWYKPGNNNKAIKLNIIEQTNLQLIKSEEATPDEYRTSMLRAENFPGGLADDGRGPDEMDDEVVFTVTTEQEFLAALGSNRTVIIGKDVHLNLSRVLENEKLFMRVPGRRWATDATAHIGNEPLAISEVVSDGRQLALVNFNQLTIRGAGNSSIEVDPRYSYCLYFINCEHCEVRNLTIGHTEYGTCSGGVIGVRGGKLNVMLDCDLYGCGTYGLDLYDTQDFAVLDTKVRDCTYGIMQVFRSQGVGFSSCDFLRNREYDLVEAHGTLGLSFTDCRFYANDGDAVLFNLDNEVYMSGCEIYHPTENLGTINFIDMKDMKFSPNPFDVDIPSRKIGPDQDM